MSTLKVQRVENTGVIYADPAEADLTVRFRNTSTSKSIDGKPLKNVATEIIINDDNVVSVGGSNVTEALSIRLRVSGSPLSKARLGVLLDALCAQVPTWHDEDVFVGFNPVTAPVIPAV